MSTLKVNSISPRTGTKLSITGSIESSQPILSASHALQADAALTAVTASYAISASHEIVTEVSSSHAINADIAPFSGLTGKPTLLSGSAQIASEISGSFGADSASLASRIVSNDTDILALQNFSSSLDNTYATDAEVATAVSGLNAATSSYALKTQITGSFNILSASLASRIASNDTDINTLGNTNNTQDTKIGNLTAATSSYALSSDISGSFNVVSASLASRITSNDTDIAINVTDIANRQLIVTSSSPAQNSYTIPILVECTLSGSTFLTGSFETASILRLNYSGSNGTHVLTLPDATTTTNTYRNIRVISNGTIDNQHQVSLVPSGSQTLDGGSGGFTFNRSYEGVMVWSDGTEWYQIQAKNV